MKERFLVEDWTGKDPRKGEDPKIEVADQDELFKIVHNAVEGLPKIAVHKIGECLIDWS